jgi:hypothetical protein
MHCGCGGGATNNTPIACGGKTGNITPMHFSTHIATLHSTFSLMAALLLRGAR